MTNSILYFTQTWAYLDTSLSNQTKFVTDGKKLLKWVYTTLKVTLRYINVNSYDNSMISVMVVLVLSISIAMSGALFFVILDACFPTSKFVIVWRNTSDTSLKKENMDWFAKLFCFYKSTIVIGIAINKNLTEGVVLPGTSLGAQFCYQGLVTTATSVC